MSEYLSGTVSEVGCYTGDVTLTARPSSCAQKREVKRRKQENASEAGPEHRLLDGRNGRLALAEAVVVEHVHERNRAALDV